MHPGDRGGRVRHGANYSGMTLSPTPKYCSGNAVKIGCPVANARAAAWVAGHPRFGRSATNASRYAVRVRPLTAIAPLRADAMRSATCSAIPEREELAADKHRAGRSRVGPPTAAPSSKSGHLASLLLSSGARQTRDQSEMVYDIAAHGTRDD